MENQIQIFNNPAFGEIRTIVDENDTPWFVGKDVAEVLGYKDSVNALKTHVDPEDSMGWQITTPSRGRQNIKIINESGLYSLILSSKLPQAKEFKRWVTSDVLPTIRKHGAYMTDQAIEQALLDPDTVIKLATSLKEEREARRALEIKNAQQVALIAEQETKIQDMTEKSVYCEQVLASKELVEITLIAQDYGTTGRMMNRFLHSAGVQFPQGGTWVLYEDYKYKGYTQSKSFNIKKDDGTSITRMNTMWTQKGRMFLYKFLKEKYGALPIVERDENYVQPYGLMSSTAKKMCKKKQA